MGGHGTPPLHRDFTQGEECMVLAVAHPWASASSYLVVAVSRQILAATFIVHATSRSSHSDSSFSLLPLHPLTPCRSPLPRSATPPPPADPLLSRPLSPLGVRNSPLLAAYFGPSSLSSSPRDHSSDAMANSFLECYSGARPGEYRPRLLFTQHKPSPGARACAAKSFFKRDPPL